MARGLEQRVYKSLFYKSIVFEEIKKQIKSFLASEVSSKTVYPPLKDIYSFTRLTPLSSIKVVILGQDPYHGPNQAHGLCFSVQKPVPPPPSLINIYKELKTDIPGFTIPKNGDLQGWAREGVLLLNATLTVRKGEANSHAKCGWMIFTDAIIAHLNRSCDKLVFMLWGGFAQKKGSMINSRKHLILKATHPSPLGANKGGWFGCQHFSKANTYLEKAGKTPVDWTCLD